MLKGLEDRMKSLEGKVDRILELLETGTNARRRNPRSSAQNSKSVPLSAEELQRNQSQFERLFAAWEAGEELEVEKELDRMEACDLRRFAEANNVSVTSNSSKPKMLQLIAQRFRERRQLIRSSLSRAVK
ncbi:MAG TPA: hypothetical protein VK749_04445 [Xanthobacteraceae bacterium]|nr:hypothetical protein [Xanthobacteraceae bacterium]